MDHPQQISLENCQDKILMLIFITILSCISIQLTKHLFLNTYATEKSSKAVKVMYENIMQ